MIRQKNIVLQSIHGRPFLADIFYVPDGRLKPVVIFVHGFKGFKDWGPFDLMAEAFAEAGYVFVKHNFSFDGTTVEDPVNFADPEAFGNNNFSKELDDLGTVIDWVCSEDLPVSGNEVDTARIYLIGHSRGGGIIMLKAGEDTRISRISPWASVNEFGKYWKKDEMDKIKADGVIYIENSRTKQQLPVYWQLYEDYLTHQKRLYIPDVVRRLTIPMLIIHSRDDDTVPYTSAEELKQWKPDAELIIFEKGGHVFESQHPWTADHMPGEFSKAVDEAINFFKR